ncbi:MAG TPA: hypothetical protein VEA80_11930 [Vitreimonas sp.]|uniref:hypothetical protein n=1 Tax=Vitreimonas sp. TaxID=3069702 RepID=UPI002D33C9AF|nr:hypothetical protein [Vitreimonas sp.]HYD88179.1 hypothetical protein [Vitreimonas sp.]
MRWFLGFVLVVALVTGALYAVGRFLLPNQLEVMRVTQIERPRASVFAMINDLNIAKEWSPYYARDPNAQFTISPDPGQGQRMHWTSNVREVGSGSMSIVRSMENQSVEGIIQIGERATLNSRLDLERAEGITGVTWSVGGICPEGWVNVPCRYMNLIMRSTIEKELDDGLARLKDRAEQLPPHDFEGYDIVEVVLAPQNVMFVDVTLSNMSPSFDEGYNAEQQGVAALEGAVTAAGGQADRSKLIRAYPQDNGAGGRYRFSVGYEYSGPTPVLIGSRVGQTPGGAVLRGTFVGRRSQVAQMYARLEAYRQAHRIGLRPGADYWEIATPVAQPEGGNPTDPMQRIEIYVPIEGRSGQT